LTSCDRDAVLDQLERILSSLVFRNSRRNSSLLRHAVNRMLEGRPEDLKERTIGVEVFGRPIDYDTNSDHVVRSVAGDVRRRLAQYYMEPGRETELRIDLQTGSYVPQFRWPVASTAVREADSPSGAFEAGAAPQQTPPRRWQWLTIAIVVPALAVATILVARLVVPTDSFGRFWNPVFTSANAALLCVGGGRTIPAPADQAPPTLGEFERQPSRRMHVSDATALAGLVGLLQSHGKPYRVLNRADATSFRDLQLGPFVLIGAMNNEWTLRLTDGLRFGFERQGSEGARVVDRQNPSNTAWAVDFATPLTQFNRDYAIVSRVRDPKTEQTAVIVAGIASFGTLAAAEFVTNPDHLKKLDAFAPKHWEQKNVQVVIATDVIRGSSGPPTVLAAHFW
jgi:hypothetical protein